MTQSPIDRILERLDSPKKSGKGWVAKCPAHDDKNPSLSVGTASDGTVLIRCFAGCTVAAVVEALGLRMADLFPGDSPSFATNGRTHSVKPSTACRDVQPKHDRVAAAGIERDLAAYRRDATPERINDLAKKLGVAVSAIEALAVGFDGDLAILPERTGRGELVGLLRRWPKGDKKIRTGDGRGLTIPCGFQNRNGPVYVTEGASDCLVALTLGLRTVGRPNADGGSVELIELLATVPDEVIVLSDNDEPGRRGAAKVAQAVADGLRRSVSILNPPDGDKDIRETLARCGSTNLALDELLAQPRIEMHPSGDETPATGDETSKNTEEIEVVSHVATVAKEYRPFPTDLLPDPLAAFVRETSTVLGIDAGFVAPHVLAVVGSAIGTMRHVALRGSWREFPIVWAAVVARSGTLKTPAMDLALAPLREIRNREFETHETAVAQFEADEMRHQVELSNWKKDPIGDPPAKPVPPACVRHVVSDTTVEALAVILKSNPRGVLVERDELRGWVGDFDKYRSGGRGSDESGWLSMHGGGPLTVDRKSSGTIHVPSAAVSVCGGLQPGIFREVFTRERFASGLVARLLLVAPPAPRKAWRTADVSRRTVDRYAKIVEALTPLASGVDCFGKAASIEVPMTDAARRAWRTFYDQHAGRQYDAGDDDLAAMLSKLEGYAARFALIFALAEAADAGNLDKAMIDARHVENAAGLIEWWAYEIERILEGLDRSPLDADLLNFIRRRGGSATVRDVAREGPRRLRGDADDVRTRLDRFTKTGVGRWIATGPGDKGGRPTDVFELLAPATGDTTHENAEFREGFVATSGDTTPDGRDSVGTDETGDSTPATQPSGDTTSKSIGFDGGFVANPGDTTSDFDLDPIVDPPDPGDGTGTDGVPAGWTREAWAAACEADGGQAPDPNEVIEWSIAV